MSDNPQRWECGNCGYAFYDTDGWESWYCSQCGEEMHTAPPEGYTPNEDLRDLLERWETWVKQAREEDIKHPVARREVEKCAEDLEESINDD